MYMNVGVTEWYITHFRLDQVEADTMYLMGQLRQFTKCALIVIFIDIKMLNFLFWFFVKKLVFIVVTATVYWTGIHI